MEEMNYKLTVYFYREGSHKEIYPGFEASFDSLASAEVSVEFVAGKWPDICYSRVSERSHVTYYTHTGKSVSRDQLAKFLVDNGIKETQPQKTDRICTCR